MSIEPPDVPHPSASSSAAPPVAVAADDAHVEAEPPVPPVTSGTEPEVKVVRKTDVVKPSYDLKRVLAKLRQGEEEVSDNEKMKLLLGIHTRFFHAPATELARMMRASGQGIKVIKMCSQVPTYCTSCYLISHMLHV